MVKYESKLKGGNNYDSNTHSNIRSSTYHICSYCICSYPNKDVWNESKRLLGIY